MERSGRNPFCFATPCQAIRVPVAAAANALVDAKAAAGRSERYCRDLRLRLGRLCGAYGDKIIAQIGTADLEGFLAGLNVAAETRNSYRRNFVTLWGFAEKRGWAAQTTAAHTEIAKAIAAPPAILTTPQAAALRVKGRRFARVSCHRAFCRSACRGDKGARLARC
jgi:lysophospholipase L1-like esterase